MGGGETLHAPYGELVPWGDGSWYRGYHSPYYKATHAAWRDRVRTFCEEHINPFVDGWDEKKQLPHDLFGRFYAAGLLPGCVGAPWPTEFAGPCPVDDFDYFHEMILIDEMGRCGSGGVLWGLCGGLSIGLPPVLHFMTGPVRERVARECLRGEKVICLAITEPYAGSDVAGLRATAVKSADGTHYVVNGEKKWITNGVFADYFTVAVRTGGPGMGGISLLLLDRSMGGIETKQMECMGVWSSGTAFVTMTDVKVPVSHLIGTENQGFKCIMQNFNHERFTTCVEANRFARVCLEDALRYAKKRKTFGKTLIEHPVIRFKLAEMARQVEATHALTENLCYQMCRMSKMEAMTLLGGDTALLKVQATKTFEYCAREAAQIMGGVSYVRGGQGEKVERLYREVRAFAIPAGSEEIMLDLAVRQAVKQADSLDKKTPNRLGQAKM